LILILCGKTASGKTTICNELVKRGYKKIVTYTTRPKRHGEINGKDYHFITEEEFEKKRKENFFMEFKYYYTENGRWWYGSAAKDYDDSENKVVILTPDVLWQIQENCKADVTSIYVYSNRETILTRLKERGDNKKEAERRVFADDVDFRGVTQITDKIVYNNLGDKLSDVVDKILALVKGDE